MSYELDHVKKDFDDALNSINETFDILKKDYESESNMTTLISNCQNMLKLMDKQMILLTSISELQFTIAEKMKKHDENFKDIKEILENNL